MIWTGTAWVTVSAPACVGCGQITWLDRFHRCGDCALYDDLGLVLVPMKYAEPEYEDPDEQRMGDPGADS